MPDEGPSIPIRTYERRRARMIETLRKRGVSDARVLGAMGRVLRHRFVEPALHHRAYNDEALPIGLKQTISQPFTVAYQTSLLGVRPGDRVLEVGTGSGYQAAVLCEMRARVFSIERHGPLLRRTQRLLRDLGYRVTAKQGDGTFGWPAFAPYDAIVVTAGAAAPPDALLEQLCLPGEKEKEKKGGRLIIPIGDAQGQKMRRITRTGEDQFEHEDLHSFRFVPLIGEGGGGLA